MACITDQHLDHIVPPLFPQLLRVFAEPAAYSDTIRARALQVYRSGLELIQMISADEPNRAHGLLQPTLAGWLEAIAAALAAGDRTPIIIRVAALEVRGQARVFAGAASQSFLTRCEAPRRCGDAAQPTAYLLSSFASLVAPYANGLLSPVWELLTTSKDR